MSANLSGYRAVIYRKWNCSQFQRPCGYAVVDLLNNPRFISMYPMCPFRNPTGSLSSTSLRCIKFGRGDRPIDNLSKAFKGLGHLYVNVMSDDSVFSACFQSDLEQFVSSKHVGHLGSDSER